MIAAIIILYHPDKVHLKKLISSVIDQVDLVSIIDNTETPCFSQDDFKNDSKLFYLALSENLGIAKAQNIGIEKAIKDGFDHVLLLDQDSCLPKDFTSKLLKAEQKLSSSGKKVSAIGPLYIDEKTKRYARAIRNQYLDLASVKLEPTMSEPVEADYIIASGSIIRTDVLKTVGLMDDNMFIDCVDIEWSFRARSLGYLAYILPTTEMKHSIGDDFIKIFGKFIMIHSAFRNRYIIRNSCYLMRLPYVHIWWKLNAISKLPCYLLIYSWNSANKLKSFFELVQASIKGFQGKLGKISAN